MTSIETRFLGPTNFRGSRYKAIAGEGGKGYELTVDADSSLGSEENHGHAQRVCSFRSSDGSTKSHARRHLRRMVRGWHTSTGYVFVCAVSYAKLEQTPKAVR